MIKKYNIHIFIIFFIPTVVYTNLSKNKNKFFNEQVDYTGDRELNNFLKNKFKSI